MRQGWQTGKETDMHRRSSPRLPAPRVGVLEPGPRDLISDVPGVRVGHATLAEGAIQTGATVILPHGRDEFLHKVPAAAAVINGFGKSLGLVQLREMGVLETPIALTNTFSVGAVAQAQIRQAVLRNPAIGRDWATVNPLVFECNDGYLNDIQAMAVSEQDYLRACAAASPDFAQGSVGAGRGMSCFALKGGIGSASRLTPVAAARRYTVGALVLANFGRLPNLTVKGRPLGRYILDGGGLPNRPAVPAGIEDESEKGSIIMALATDAPLDARQLGRVARRAGAGLARTGSVYGSGSGDIALAFTTAYQVPHVPDADAAPVGLLHESLIDPLFEAAAEAVEQAVVHALWSADAVEGRDGHRRAALTEILPCWHEYMQC
jgi:D-aminopeptidase